MRHLALSILVLLVGCPTPDEAGSNAESAPTIQPLGSAPPAETASGEAAAGDWATGEEAVGDTADEAGAEGTAEEGAPLAGAPDQIDAQPSTGEPSEGQVSISGTLKYAGSKTGQYRIEFLQLGEGPPNMLHYEKIDGPGPWTVFAPVNAGEIHIVAFIDQAGDGASSDDPGALWSQPVLVTDQAITGIALVLEDEPDLGELAPKDHADAATGAEVPGVDPPPEGADQAAP